MDVEEGVIKTAHIGIKGGVFSFVGEQIPRGQGVRYTRTIDCTNKYVAPGLLDAHTHLELSLLSAVPYAEAVLPHGTTAVILDCHDFVNVLGMKGLELIMEESRHTPLRSFFMVPPCVPSAVGFEDSGAVVGLEEVKRSLSLPGVLGLAEVMDTYRVLQGEEELQRIIQFARDNDKIIDGHCPGLSAEEEERYFQLSGAKTDHESTSVQEALSKLDRSLWVYLRRTSFGPEYSYKKVFEREGAWQRVMLCSDGCLTPNDILNSGHLNTFVRELINEGVEPIKVLRAVTINPATCYGLDEELGSIKEGKKADFVILSDLGEFKVEAVYIDGKEIKGTSFPRFNFPSYALNTIKVNVPSISQLAITVPEPLKDREEVDVLVIKLERNSFLTRKMVCTMRNDSGLLRTDVGRDILKVVVMERHGLGLPPVVGFISGFGLKEGAFGGSIGQDSQHITVVGCNDDDILTVVQAIKENQGGIFYSKQNEILAGLALPVGGIMTSEPPQKVVKMVDHLNSVLWENGCTLSSPYLTLALQITLPVIPELKLTNRGLLDVNNRKFVSLFTQMDSN